MRRPASKLEIKFAKKLKSLRGETSQLQFAKRIGIAQSTLNRIENGEQSVTLYLLETISEKLKIKPKDLIEP